MRKPTGFFQVSLSSADAENEESAAEATGHVDEFVQERDGEAHEAI